MPLMPAAESRGCSNAQMAVVVGGYAVRRPTSATGTVSHSVTLRLRSLDTAPAVDLASAADRTRLFDVDELAQRRLSLAVVVSELGGGGGVGEDGEGRGWWFGSRRRQVSSRVVAVGEIVLKDFDDWRTGNYARTVSLRNPDAEKKSKSKFTPQKKAGDYDEDECGWIEVSVSFTPRENAGPAGDDMDAMFMMSKFKNAQKLYGTRLL